MAAVTRFFSDENRTFNLSLFNSIIQLTSSYTQNTVSYTQNTVNDKIGIFSLKHTFVTVVIAGASKPGSRGL